MWFGTGGKSNNGHQSSGSCTSTSPSQFQLKISHEFHPESYFIPTHCASCSTLIKGVFRQGFQCTHCKKNYCPKCKLKSETLAEGCPALAPTTSTSATLSKQAGHCPRLSTSGELSDNDNQHDISTSSGSNNSTNGQQQQQIGLNNGDSDDTKQAETITNHSNMFKQKWASTSEGDTATASNNNLKGINSNVSRDNIRLHRLAPSVRHIKRPDLTKPIIEGWLQHKTRTDEQRRRHYWRLDDTDITLYENNTSIRYFKAVALSKITRVISASSLPKQVKEDVLLSGWQSAGGDNNSSPAKTSEMKAMFGFEVATGSVYLVQASDASEANRWKRSLEAITTKRLLELQVVKKDANQNEAAHQPQPVASNEKENQQQQALKQQHHSETTRQPQQEDEPNNNNLMDNTIKNASDQLLIRPLPPLAAAVEQMNIRHHHHTPSNYRGQHKTYTDPNRSRLYNRPRIVIKLNPMDIPEHWIEAKYLLEPDRTRGVGFEELGSGQFGKVFAAISEIKREDPVKGLWSGVPVAIKEISKAQFDLRHQAKLKNEATILSRLDHPGVIILERVHDLPDKIYIVMEQLEDDMLEMIVSTPEKRLDERVTKFLTYQILEALKYLHAQNVAHCDLKPENVLLVERRSQFPQIKLCDFGFAKIIEENSFRSSLVGTPAYLAPEVVRGERYNRSVDLWSVGVIVYVSLSGEFPFNEGENIHDQISRANFMYPDQPWAKISNQAKNFINSLLRVNSDKRLSTNRAQMDDWIQDYQLWCDLCELEMRVGKRWVTDDADFERWTRFASENQMLVPRSAIKLHDQLMGGD